MGPAYFAPVLRVELLETLGCSQKQVKARYSDHIR